MGPKVMLVVCDTRPSIVIYLLAKVVLERFSQDFLANELCDYARHDVGLLLSDLKKEKDRVFNSRNSPEIKFQVMAVNVSAWYAFVNSALSGRRCSRGETVAAPRCYSWGFGF